MKISLIVAMGKQRQIGLDNKLLWHLPADLQNFRQITSGKTVIMGRKTFESIGRPLPKRTNIVISSGASSAEGFGTAAQAEWPLLFHSSVEQTLQWLNEKADAEVFVIGGGRIYEQFLPFANRIYLSTVEYDGPADTFFPVWQPEQWQHLETQKFTANAEKNWLAWSFSVLEKNSTFSLQKLKSKSDHHLF